MSMLSIVIPAFNEAQALGPVLVDLQKKFPQAEVIVVDDGSTDGTGEVAREAGATLVRHPVNGGYGKSLKDGILQAKNDVIVITDADGSYPLDGISDLLRLFEQGFDMVVGARSGREYRGSFLKMPARILLKWLTEFTTGRKIPDINSGLRVFRKSEAIKYFPDLCNGFSFTTTITLIYMLTGKYVAYTPIEYFKRVGTSKVRIIRDSLRTLQYITETVVRYNPLKFFLLLSLPVFVLSMIVGILFWSNNEALSILVLLIGLIGSIIIFGTGLTIHSLRRTNNS